MEVMITLGDFPQDEANCGNCTRKGGCARSDKRYHNGYIVSEVTGNISGIIYKCPNYTGRFKKD